MPTNRRKVTSEDLKQEVLAKIKQYEDKDFPGASAIHELIMKTNPSLCPRLWYITSLDNEVKRMITRIVSKITE